MQGSKKAPLPVAAGNASSRCLTAPLNRWKMQTQHSFRTNTRRRRIVPGLLPRLAVIRAAHSSYLYGTPSGLHSASSMKTESENSDTAASAVRPRPTKPLYKVSEDPLLQQTQRLLEASRRLREQPLLMHNIDQQGYFGCSSSSAGVSQDSVGQQRSLPKNDFQVRGSGASALAQFALDPANAFVTTASATAAARLSAVRSAAIHATTPSESASALFPPSVSEPTGAAAVAGTSTGRAVLTATAATATVTTAFAVIPPAATANSAASLSAAAASAASAASSGWLVIEELLEEAAYSLSQEIPDGRSPSPLDALRSATNGPSDNASGSVLGMDLQQQLQGLGQSTSSPVSLPLPGLGLDLGASGLGGGSLVAAVPGGDRLSEMLEDLLYSMSQDVNLAAAQEAVLATASAVAAGLVGAASELPRAAASVYRSAADAAAVAAAARAAAARGPSGGGSGGTALVVPDEDQALQATAGLEFDAGDVGITAVPDMTESGNPAWDPYGTIRAGEGAATPLEFSAATAGVAADVGGTAATSAAPEAGDIAVSVLPPIVSASTASSIADAATATAAAVVEAATTAAEGTIIITPPSRPPPSTGPTPPPMVSSAPSGTFAASPQAQPQAAQPPTFSDGGASYGIDPNGYGSEDTEQLDELTAALQNLLAGPESLSSAGVSGLEASDAVSAATALSDDAATSATEAALSTFTEALRRELGAVVSSASDAVDTDPSALAQSAGLAVRSALDSLSLEQQIGLSSLPPDLRLSTLLGATLQSVLDLVESALSGIRSADSTLVGGITITVVLAVLIRSLVSLAGAALNRTRVGTGEAAPDGGDGSGLSETTVRMRPVGVTALEAAAALNNDAQALLIDIRNASDVREQGLPDLRPFRRGAGAATVSLPYCDFRTTPTLANPSGSLFIDRGLLGKGGASAAVSSTSTALAPLAGTVTVSVDPTFCSKFKHLEGLNRDSRVFLIDSYGVEAPEAVLLLRSDPEIERLLGAQGVKYIEGGFAGPEGWKLTGLPVADAPVQLSDGSVENPGLGLDLSSLISGVTGLRFRYPSLFTRTLAVGAVGGAGVAVASSLDWGAVSRGAVGLAAAMLVTDRVLPSGVRPSGRIRQYLQSQMADPPLGTESSGQGTSSAADLVARRRRTALLIRALDLAETVGDAVVRAGGVAVAAAGSAAKSAITARHGAAGAVGGAADIGPGSQATTVDLNAAELETPHAQAAGAAAATIVLPHGMDSREWSEAAELAIANAQQEQPVARATASALGAMPQNQTRSASPLRTNWRLGPSSPSDSSSPSLSPAAAAATAAAIGLDDVKAAAAVASSSELLPPQSSIPSLAGRLTGALRSAANAVVRAASPTRSVGAASIAGLPVPASSPLPRSNSPNGDGSSQPDTLELMAALATASALSNLDSGLLPGWPAISFPKASAGQVATTTSSEEEPEEGGFKEDKAKEPHTSEHLDSRSLLLQSSDVEAASHELADSTIRGYGTDLWSNWRQELETVAPAPPALPSEEEPIGGGTSSGNTFDHDLYGSGNASVAASRLGLSSSWTRDISLDGDATGGRSTDATTSAAAARHVSSHGSGSHGAHQGQSQERRPSRKLLRTSSPERAAAAGAALRQLRMQMDGLDDDGLVSGAYGTGGVYRSIFDDAAADDKRSGVAAERITLGRDGLSRDHPAGQQQQQMDSLFSGTAGSYGRQKQPLRTASPQRVAEAAAAMRKLRAEMGLPPNDGRDADALIPRDWRREVDAAAATPGSFSASDSDSEPAPGEANRLHSSQAGSGSSSRHRSGITTSASLSSPHNWRAQLEDQDQLASNSNTSSASGGRISDGSGGPAGWRAQIQGGGPAAAGLGQDGNGRVSNKSYGHDTSGADGSFVSALRTTTSPGRAKLTAAERAARDARLQDWRARM